MGAVWALHGGINVTVTGISLSKALTLSKFYFSGLQDDWTLSKA